MLHKKEAIEKVKAFLEELKKDGWILYPAFVSDKSSIRADFALEEVQDLPTEK